MFLHAVYGSMHGLYDKPQPYWSLTRNIGHWRVSDVQETDSVKFDIGNIPEYH